jgi:hypothetical protein
VYVLLAFVVVAIARLWLNPPPFEPDHRPFVDDGFEAFAADERARIELDRIEENGGNPPDRKEGPYPPLWWSRGCTRAGKLAALEALSG